jgi:hypothetical protein
MVFFPRGIEYLQAFSGVRLGSNYFIQSPSVTKLVKVPLLSETMSLVDIMLFQAIRRGGSRTA